MADYFVCLDTCVLFDLVQSLETAKRPEWWSELKAIVEAGDVKLLSPKSRSWNWRLVGGISKRSSFWQR